MDIEIMALSAIMGFYRKDFERFLQPSVQPMTDAIGTFAGWRKQESTEMFMRRLVWENHIYNLLGRSNDKLYEMIGKRMREMKIRCGYRFSGIHADSIG